jgi:catalase
MRCDLFRLMPPESQQRLMDNIAEAMQGVPVEIVKRQVAHFYRADPAYGLGVATRMGHSAADLPSDSTLRAEETVG